MYAVNEKAVWREKKAVELEYVRGMRNAVQEMPACDEPWITPQPQPRWPCLVREAAVEHRHLEPLEGPALEAAHLEPGPAVEDTDDELFQLGERCAEAYMQSDSLQYRAMTLLAEFDGRRGWEDTGFSSTAEWLAWRIGIKPNAARERVRTALALEHLPETSEAMKNGGISFTKVRTLTRAATPDNEATLLEFARSGSAANLERVIRGWQTLDRRSELTAEKMRHRRRRFSAWVDDDGTVVVRGRLDPEVGAVLMRAVEAANDALFRANGDGRGDDVTAVTSEDESGAGQKCCGGPPDVGVRPGSEVDLEIHLAVPVSSNSCLTSAHGGCRDAEGIWLRWPVGAGGRDARYRSCNVLHGGGIWFPVSPGALRRITDV